MPAGGGHRRAVAGFTGQHLIAPQTILVRAYLEQIFTGLRVAGLSVFHVVLDADEDILRQRILGSDEAQAWRLAHLAEYRASRSWITATADLVVDTGHRTPAETARHIAGALPDVTSRAALGRQRSICQMSWRPEDLRH